MCIGDTYVCSWPFIIIIIVIIVISIIIITIIIFLNFILGKYVSEGV